LGKDVYRIDLSQVVSKYIGETEKNLETIFKKAESKDWVLFFDEADALFGKRTSVQSSHDKICQPGSKLPAAAGGRTTPACLSSRPTLRITWTRLFLRRFHSVVHFPMPNAGDRLVLWKKTLPESLSHHTSITCGNLPTSNELSGASILNAVPVLPPCRVMPAAMACSCTAICWMVSKRNSSKRRSHFRASLGDAGREIRGQRSTQQGLQAKLARSLLRSGT
jgi:hypothetical protein